MNGYDPPELTALGSIHAVTGVLVSSSRNDFVWGPSGEVLNEPNDLGSLNLCTLPDDQVMVCEAP